MACGIADLDDGRLMADRGHGSDDSSLDLLLGRVRGAKRSDNKYRNLYDEGMKTTLDIDDQLLSEAKALAANQRTSLTRLIEEGLHLRLRKQPSGRRGKIVLPVLKGRGGLVAGLDPLSNKALLDALGDDA
jgi:hypothetical protein